MLSVLVVLVLMTVQCFSIDPAKCQSPASFLGATTCDDSVYANLTDTFTVIKRAECAKRCSESSDCKSLDVQSSEVDNGEYVCRLYSTRWPQDTCVTSSSRHNKIENANSATKDPSEHQIECKNGGVLEGNVCRCVGGYVGIECEEIMNDCHDGFLSGMYMTSGKYKVWPKTAPSPFQVYCEMTTKAGKTIIQRNTVGGGVDFNRTWDEYDAGFGNLSGDHWLGNTYFHHLTQKQPGPVLTVSLIAGGIWKFRYFFRFNLSDKANLFRLSYEWSEKEAEDEHSLGDCLKNVVGYGFSTFDQDNDGAESHCAERRAGGWWFRTCFRCNLNGKITGQPYSVETDVNWATELNSSLAITSTKMHLSG